MTLSHHRISLLTAALLTVTFFSTILDTPRRRLIVLPPASFKQPPPPEDQSPRAPLQIEVTDEQGALVPGASVAVYLIREQTAYTVGLQITDDQGVATLERIPLGELWVLTEAPGRQRASTRLVLGPKGGHTRVTLHRAQRLVVQVVDEAEHAVPGASVEVRSSDPLPYLGKSDAAGVIEFSRLGPGPWSVRASAPGYEAASKSGVRARLLPQRLTLRSLGSLVVSVQNPDGSPARQATVEVAGSGLWPARTTTTDDQGQVRIAALPAGAYNVFAS
ncbi:MAG: carboxypeptidase-like regulatory domain-containing protein, partial [Myxococcales bacterium]|nr:carboxypeptidase-like regulatory domain-containing protein [Polyangiaceae bacterium]MDW8251142.1 carboxypeptidase-like regulatory domain-containing protein [Myxococcales bacterium]